MVVVDREILLFSSKNAAAAKSAAAVAFAEVVKSADRWLRLPCSSSMPWARRRRYTPRAGQQGSVQYGERDATLATIL